MALDRLAIGARVFVLRHLKGVRSKGPFKLKNYFSILTVLLFIAPAAVMAAGKADANTSLGNHKGGIFWLTGLSGAGKTTTARKVEKIMKSKGAKVIVLDGDVLRDGLISDLKFSKKDREENVRRVTEVAKLLAKNDIIVICSLISPFAKDRKKIQSEKNAWLVYMDADVNTCIKRDPKGLYKKALAGEIPNFTGISSPYEVPEEPDLVISTAEITPDESAEILSKYIFNKVS